jgi:phosphoribosylanthranilate isomerase
MFVKICGLTNREDALVAAACGARALGFVFYPHSPRYLAPAALANWIGDLPEDVWKVGVWVDADPALVESTSRDLGLDIAQLHGSETADTFPRSPRIWKAVRISGAEAPKVLPGVAEALLLDGPGSGRTFDWSVAQRAAHPFLLAGGLTPENVAAAVRATRPWGVDTASGVELAPGRKDHTRVKMFIEAALAAEASAA